MRIKNIISTLLVLVFMFSLLSTESVLAYSTGDDYPNKYKSVASGTIVDEWNFYNRQCTSFVAWCLNSRNGVAFTNQYSGAARWGNAKTWGTVAAQLGITVDANPAVGSVAWWNTGTYGHVAWVRSVNGNNITIEEYNWSKVGGYGERTISKSSVTGGFIHIKDLSATVVPQKTTITSCTVDGSNLTATWDSVDDATSYSVDFCKVEGTTYNHDYYSTNNTSMTKSLSDGLYGIRVSADNSAGNSGFTKFYYIWVSNNTVPESPVITDTEVNENTVTVSWNGVEYTNGYMVELHNLADDISVLHETADTVYTFELNDGNYGVRVFAVNSAGVQSEETNFNYFQIDTGSSHYTVNSLSGEVINGKYYAEAEVIKNTERDSRDMVVIAVYKDDIMIDMVYMKANFDKGQSVSFGGMLEGDDGAVLKAFVWDSMTGMVSLSNVIEK